MKSFVNIDHKGKVSLCQDGTLSHHSHHKSERNYLSSFYFLKSIVLFLGFLFFLSCERDDKLIVENTKLKSQKNTDKKRASNLSMKSSSSPYGWEDQGTNKSRGIRKFYNASNKWYVIKVYLPSIRIKPIYKISDGRNSNNPVFYKKNINKWKNDSKGRGADVLINGSFFNLSSIWGETTVSHEFGYNTSIISGGSVPNEWGQQQLRIRNKRAIIGYPVCVANFELSVNGLSLNVNKDKNSKIGRTMVGVNSSRRDILYFFVTANKSGCGATQNEGKSALQSFGCTEYMMLDGSSSSQMTWNGTTLVNGSDYGWNRRIPMVLRMDHR